MDRIAPQTAIESQNVPVGDSLRVRVQYLTAQHQAMVVQTQFADAKAAALLTLSGLAILRVPLPDQMGLVHVTLIIVLFATILLCLLAVMPRYGAAGYDVNDRFSWVALCDAEPARLVDFARDGDLPELLTSLATSNVGGARVLKKKFRLIRLAFLGGIAAIVLAGLIGLRHLAPLASLF